MYTRFNLLGMFVACSVAAATVYAQRGTGESSGVARQAVKPEVVWLEGKLLSIEVGPCEQTTGRASIGTHLKVETAGKKQLNIHLGPATFASSIVSKLKISEPVKIEAFRTPKLAADHYVAKTLHFNGETMQLRNENLRPEWADSGVSPPMAPRPCPRAEGRGYRYSYYPGTGRGMRYGYGWRSRR